MLFHNSHKKALIIFYSLLDRASIFVFTVPEHFERFVLLQIFKLATVDGATTSLPNVLYGVFVFHTALDKGQCHKNGGTPQTGHTVDSYCSAWVFFKRGFKKVKPRLDNVAWWCCTVVEFPVLFLQKKK